MKRSELITRLKKHLRTYQGEDYEGWHIDAAEDVLRMCEAAGMLPPGYMKPIPFEEDGYQYPLVPGDFQNNSRVWCTPGINEWEPEDE